MAEYYSYAFKSVMQSMKTSCPGDEAGQYCQSCTGLTTLDGLQAACTKEGYVHSSIALLRLSSATCKLCKHIFESRSKWEESLKSVKLCAIFKKTALSPSSGCDNTKVCSDHPLQGAVLDEFGIGGIMIAGSKQLIPMHIQILQTYSLEGDPASSIITRRPVLTDVGGATAMHHLRNRLKNCREHHPQSSSSDIFPLPTRLLDIGFTTNSAVRLRSTKGESGIYCALSYCWGGECQPMTTQANLTARLASLNVLDLPQTICDAITVTRSLGFQYLWIDALCIIQDDPLDKKTEIKMMGSIFQNAALVISASSSTKVSEGFLHQRSDPSPIRLPFALSKDSNGTIGFCQHVYADVAAEALQQRGWALQEHVLARRVAMFCTHEVVFRCCSYFEPIQESHIDYLQFGYLALLTTHVKDVDEDLRKEARRHFWMDMVNHYSKRKFSEPEDRINALVGLATEYSKIYNDIYLLGLWRDLFIHHLGWHPVHDQQHPVHDRTRSGDLPTWSWLSLNTHISLIHTNLISEEEHRDAQLIEYGRRRASDPALYTLDDLSTDVRNREVIIRVRTMPASSYIEVMREETYDKAKIHLDCIDSETIPLESTLALLYLNQDSFQSLLLRPATVDNTKMERIGLIEPFKSPLHCGLWNNIPYVTLTLV